MWPDLVVSRSQPFPVGPRPIRMQEKRGWLCETSQTFFSAGRYHKLKAIWVAIFEGLIFVVLEAIAIIIQKTILWIYIFVVYSPLCM